jgi:hypothetical protein
MSQFPQDGLGVPRAAADARKTPVAARHPARTRELSARPATDSRDATLPTGTPTWPAELTAGATVAIGVTAAAAWVLLEDHVSGSRAGRARTRFGCRHRHDSHRCGNSPTNNKRFQHAENGHVEISTPSTHVQNIEFQSW